jgi:hypothetical protein
MASIEYANAGTEVKNFVDGIKSDAEELEKGVRKLNRLYNNTESTSTTASIVGMTTCDSVNAL